MAARERPPSRRRSTTRSAAIASSGSRTTRITTTSTLCRPRKAETQRVEPRKVLIVGRNPHPRRTRAPPPPRHQAVRRHAGRHPLHAPPHARHPLPRPQPGVGGGAARIRWRSTRSSRASSICCRR